MFKAIATRGIKMNINVNTETNSHPLDRCSAVELEAAVALLKQSGNLSEEAFFVSGFVARGCPGAEFEAAIFSNFRTTCNPSSA